jgi:subtilisin family serine protease
MDLISGFASLVIGGLPADHPIVVDGAECHPANVIVRLQGPDALTDLRGAGFHITKSIPAIDAAVVQRPFVPLRENVRYLRTHPSVRSAEYDVTRQLTYVPNDPQWINQLSVQRINAAQAWDVSLGSNQTVVAVIDTGIQFNHPDLAVNIWNNADEIPGNGIDDDSNGYIDDHRGWDFGANDNDASATAGHGTQCAGVIAAVGNNGQQISGIAPRARIMALRVTNASGFIFTSATINAYVYAAENGARVMNLSYAGSLYSQAERDAIVYALGKGVLAVGAAGNQYHAVPMYPACYPEVLSVAAVSATDTKIGYSQFGPLTSVAAPAVDIVTTTLGGGTLNSFTGTSAAAPHVAGLAALIAGHRPTATPQLIRQWIEDGSKTVANWDLGEFTLYGRIDAYESMLRSDGTAWTPKPAAVRFISPIGPAPAGTRAWVRGRYPSLPTAWARGKRLKEYLRTRYDFEFDLPTTDEQITVQSGSRVVGRYRAPEPALCYPLVQASSDFGGPVIGGFLDTLNIDSLSVKVRRRSDETIGFQGVFYRVPTASSRTLVLRRQIANTTGTETVEAFVWGSNGYPSGSWVKLHSGSIPTDMTTLNVDLPNFAQLRSEVGTVVLRVTTSAGIPSNGEYRIDTAYLK